MRNSHRMQRVAMRLDSERVREEIATIEKRLEQLGPDGDCGYENAMIRFYEQQLGDRRRLLESGA